MAAPRKYGDELRERATRMAVELRPDPATRSGAIPRVAGQLGMHPETLRNWVRQAEADGSVRPGTTTDDAARLAELEREVRELRRANEILRTCGSLSSWRDVAGAASLAHHLLVTACSGTPLSDRTTREGADT